MSDERWIVIPKWDDYQHRDAARSLVPAWLKLHTELGSKPEFLELSHHLRGVLLGLWIEYARSKRQLRDSTVTLTRQLGQRVTRRDVDSLSHAGFIHFSASRPAGVPAGLEKRREEPPLTPPTGGNAKISNKELRRYTGCRYVYNGRAEAYKQDPLGTDRPPNYWPHPRPSREEILAALEEREREVPF